MSNLNHCIFTGRLTAAPELKQTKNAKSICSFSMAVESGWGDNKKVSYPNLVAWNGQAEYISKLQKGAKVAVIARFGERPWETKTGEKRKALEFTVVEIEALEPKKGTQRSDDEPAPNDGFEEVPNDDDLPF